MKKIFLTIIISFLFATPVLAHQPRLIWQNSGEIAIDQPQVSKAYYDELSGAPRTYKLNLFEPAEIYMNVLVPDLPDSRKNFSFKVFQNGEEFLSMNGETFVWEKFYEEFAGDDYWKGPEIKKVFEKGEYSIVVSNPENSGKYVFASGDIESFPFGESVKTITALPELKKYFFEKSPLTAFNNYIGIVLVVLVFLVSGIIALGIFIFRKIKHKKRK